MVDTGSDADIAQLPHPGHRPGVPTAVRLEAVSRSYELASGRVYALLGVDLEVDEGEFVVVLGPSGSGKTTLPNMIGALDVATEGTVTVAGRRLTGASRAELSALRRDTVAFIFQTFNLFPGLTADLLGAVTPLLPAPGGIREQAASGKESESPLSRSFLTALTQRAARENNELGA